MILEFRLSGMVSDRCGFTTSRDFRVWCMLSWSRSAVVIARSVWTSESACIVLCERGGPFLILLKLLIRSRAFVVLGVDARRNSSDEAGNRSAADKGWGGTPEVPGDSPDNRLDSYQPA